jgi:Zn-dependent protease
MPHATGAATLSRGMTVARLDAIEIAVHWRWLAALSLATTLLAHSVLPARFPTWELWTVWLTSAAVVLSGELALLLHELAHALVARGRGHEVERIVFHGFVAETVLGVSSAPPTPRHDALIALVGPAMNVALAAICALARQWLAPDGPVGVVLVLLAVGNAAMAALSLVPVGASDGARALRALTLGRARSSGCLSAPGPER